MNHDQRHDHQHGHRSDQDQSGEDLAHFYTREFWDERYGESDQIWSGRPNPRLVEHAADRPPGRALDVGCGEGADAVWLATRGWHVTAVDISQVALDRAAVHAHDAGVADRIELRRHDVLGGEELAGEFDLVSVQFLHVPRPVFDEVHQRIAAAVRPGGALLVAAHHPDDLATGVRRPHGPDLLFTPEQVVETLDAEEWRVEVADAPTREHQGADGPVVVRDTVVLAVRGNV